MMIIRVAVIGAGAAGLAAARHLSSHLDKFQPVVFEQTAKVGGTWVYTDNIGLDQYNLPIHSSMYKHMRTNLPKEVMAFPDLPFSEDGPSFLHHTEVLQYLERYAKHFNLYKFIKFKRVVIDAQPLDDHTGWTLVSEDVETKERFTEIFRYLIVCNGHYCLPKFPSIPGLSDFRGDVFHSHDYREAIGMTGKRVVCLGAAASGQDIGLEISKVAEHVYLSHNGLLNVPLPDNITQVTSIVSAHPEGFLLKSGESINADVLLLCTGYHFSFPFLPKGFITIDDSRVQPLYKHLVHCHNPTVAFIGIPNQICPFPHFDAQIRFYLEYLLGNMSLPSKEDMIADAERDFDKRLSLGMPARHAHKMGALQWEYSDSLADMGNFKPIKPVVKKLYDAVHDKRRRNLMDYKNQHYRLLDDENFIPVTLN